MRPTLEMIRITYWTINYNQLLRSVIFANDVQSNLGYLKNGEEIHLHVDLGSQFLSISERCLLPYK